MEKSEAFIGQMVYCGDDGTEFTITEIDDLGAEVENHDEKTWIEYDNLFPTQAK